MYILQNIFDFSVLFVFRQIKMEMRWGKELIIYFFQWLSHLFWKSPAVLPPYILFLPIDSSQFSCAVPWKSGLNQSGWLPGGCFSFCQRNQIRTYKIRKTACVRKHLYISVFLFISVKNKLRNLKLKCLN